MPRMIDYIVDAVRRPREQLTRGQHFVRYSWDLGVHCWGQLYTHRAEGMAAELTYRTIFALIPVLVLGLVVFRVFGDLEDVQDKVENELYSFFGVPPVSKSPEVITPSDETDSGNEDLQPKATESAPPTTEGDGGASAEAELAIETDPAAGPVETGDAGLPGEPPPDGLPGVAESEGEKMAEEKFAAYVRSTLDAMTDKVKNLNFASVGVVGLLVFIYAAIALADSVEYLFNRIFEAPTQRPIHIRVAIHWSIITLGSGLLAMSLYMSGQVITWFGATFAGGSTITGILSHLTAILASWILLFLLYALMPNTHVSVRAAAIGAIVSALLWEGAKFGFQYYVAEVVPQSALYASIGLVPLFLFWVYVTWLIVLFGLILTYTLQTLRGSRNVRASEFGGETLSGDPDWMLPIMSEVAHAFGQGKSIGFQELAEQLGLSSRVIREMSGKLVEAQLLRRVVSGAGDEESLTLAKPAGKIALDEILTLAHKSRRTNNHPAWQTLADLKQAERDAAEGKTLADVEIVEPTE